MIDISEKIETLRTAIAESSIRAKKETIDRAVQGETPKGNVLDVARVAGVLAAKKTPELIPFCHPLPLDSIAIEFQPEEGAIRIQVEVKTISRTGVEMEALTGASVTALTVYDMLKGIDKEVIIGETRLIEKHGGKSDFKDEFKTPLRAAVLVTSDSVSKGKKSDKSGKIILEKIKQFSLEASHYEIIPDDPETIRKKLTEWIDEKIDLILTTGGTGLGPRDVTAEVVSKIVEREVPGIAEAMRSYGQRRTPYSMLSRGVVGICGQTVIVTLPGSSRGVKESIAAIFPGVLHIFRMMRGGGH